MSTVMFFFHVNIKGFNLFDIAGEAQYIMYTLSLNITFICTCVQYGTDKKCSTNHVFLPDIKPHTNKFILRDKLCIFYFYLTCVDHT